MSRERRYGADWEQGPLDEKPSRTIPEAERARAYQRHEEALAALLERPLKGEKKEGS